MLRTSAPLIGALERRMNASDLGVVMHVAISIAAAVTAHYLCAWYLVASLVASVCAVAIFQYIVYVDSGYLDPFIAVAVFSTGVTSMVIALIVGLPFRLSRKKVADDPLRVDGWKEQ